MEKSKIETKLDSRKKTLYTVIVAIIAILIAMFIIDGEHERYSVIAFVVIGAAGFELFSWLHDKFIMRKTDTEDELAKGNMAVAYVTAARIIAFGLIMAAALLGTPGGAIGAPLHIQIASKYVGMTEIGDNRNPQIDRWTRRLGLKPGLPYCAIFDSFVLDSAKAIEPDVRSARARAFITKKSITTLQLLKILRTAPKEIENYLIIFARNGGGHIGFGEKYDGHKWCTIIEANTSPPGSGGSQWNGDGIWRKKRDLKTLASPLNRFRATHATKIIYA